VYAPQSDTFLLAEAMRHEGISPGVDVVDICTGSGALAVYAAQLGARVTAIDIGRRAAITARLNARRAGRAVRVVRGDLFSAVPGETFDMVVSNPPYVPAPGARLPRSGAARAWDAGREGRAFVDRICDTAPAALNHHGVLLMVHSALSDSTATVQRLTAAGLRPSITLRQTIAFGPVMRARQQWLGDRGLVKPEDLGEELVVIRAEKP
jgi:release factor glutamine methyltransferase